MLLPFQPSRAILPPCLAASTAFLKFTVRLLVVVPRRPVLRAPRKRLVAAHRAPARVLDDGLLEQLQLDGLDFRELLLEEREPCRLELHHLDPRAAQELGHEVA